MVKLICVAEDGTEIEVWIDDDTGYVENLEDKVDGLEYELDAAIDLMARVCSGKQSVHNMGEWISLNFPKFRERLPAQMQAKPPNHKE
tara:strand:- start:345 stop:608 length:264 start_codon:yes stop_codon:yes gene_type:complete